MSNMEKERLRVLIYSYGSVSCSLFHFLENNETESLVLSVVGIFSFHWKYLEHKIPYMTYMFLFSDLFCKHECLVCID